MDIERRIEVFGDSILKGIQINPANRRYYTDNHIDIDAIGRAHELVIHNNSRFGCTITKGLESLQKSLASGLKCTAVVMNYGGNDCDFNWKAISENPGGEHRPNTPIDLFAETYRKIIELLRSNNILPVLANLPPLEPQRFFDWFCAGLDKTGVMGWLGGINTIYRFQESYSRMVETIAREEGTPLVDIRGAFLKCRRIGHLLCEDGTHPNTEGQRVITDVFFDFATAMLPAPSPA